MCIFIRLSSIIHKKFTSTVRRKWGCWLKCWRNVGFCPPRSFLPSELVWKFPSKNHTVGKKIYSWHVDKREGKLGVGNKSAEPATIHLTWLQATDSCFHNSCCGQGVAKGGPLLATKDSFSKYDRVNTYINWDTGCSPDWCGSVGWAVVQQSKRSLVGFYIGAHAWVAGQVPRSGCVRGNPLRFLFLVLLPFPSL